MAQPFSIVTEDELLKAHPVGEPFMVEVDGDQVSFLGKVRSAYFEWIYGHKAAGRLKSFTEGYRSETPLMLLANGKRAAVAASRVRIFIAPAVEKEHKPGDPSAPEIVQERMAKQKKPIYVAEYRLEAGKTYHAMVFEESYHLPPEAPDKPPRKATAVVLHISDRPFKGGKPQIEATPAYRGWSH
jgi:hypothetical protein